MEIFTTDMNILIAFCGAIIVLLVIDMLVSIHERNLMKEDIDFLYDEISDLGIELEKKDEIQILSHEDFKAVQELKRKLQPICEMAANEYQNLAARTINWNLANNEKAFHALHGMVGEVGEIHSIYQKTFQGHELDFDHIKKEVGDLLWFVAELCTAYGWNLEDVMYLNISKLKERYPEGFDPDKSLHRKEGDV